MRIGSLGSGAFSDFQRFAGLNGNRQIKDADAGLGNDRQAQKPDKATGVNNKNMDYLERQARNAQRADRALGSGNRFDISL